MRKDWDWFDYLVRALIVAVNVAYFSVWLWTGHNPFAWWYR